MRKRNLIPYLLLVVVSVFAVAGLVKSYVGDSPKVLVEGDYIEAIAQSAGEVFGGAVEVIDKLFSGDVTIEGDLSAVNTDATFAIPLTFQQATTSYYGTRTLIVGSYRYTGDSPKQCGAGGFELYADITGTALYGGYLTVATSTCNTADAATCGDGTYSFNNTSTWTIIGSTYIATSTVVKEPLNADDNEGGFTREVYELNPNDWYVVAYIFDTETATSGDSLLNSSYTTLGGNVYISCKNE